MAKHFTGDEKLRIVLESIIRGVPKEEQCKKYECSETDFDAWREHLVTNGGKVFEPGYGIVATKTEKSSNLGRLSKIFLSFSILSNLAVVSVGLAWKMKWIDFGSYFPKSEVASSVDSSSSGSNHSSPLMLEGEQKDDSLESLLLASKSPSVQQDAITLPGSNSQIDSSAVPIGTVPVRSSSRAPLYSNLPGRDRPTFEIEAFGVRTPGRLVVFALDASEYMTRGNRVGHFRELKNKLQSAIAGLSSKSYFNLLIFRNLREVEMIGKTILPANPTNKSLALKWIKEIGEPYESTRATSISRPNDSDIVDKPPPGTVGPWYALYCAIKNYEPDAVFVLTGECSSMRPRDFSVVGPDSLGTGEASIPENLKKWEQETKTLRLTAVKWLLASMKVDEVTPTSQEELELLALARLQMTLPPKPRVSSGGSWPWRDVYEKFRGALKEEETYLPIVHFVVALPEGVTWPDDLTETVGEFARMAKGQLTFINAIMP